MQALTVDKVCFGYAGELEGQSADYLKAYRVGVAEALTMVKDILQDEGENHDD